MTRSLSLLFVILWSSAFITSKIIVDNASPFAALSFRFFIVAIGFFLFSIYLKEKIIVSKHNIYQACVSGILLVRSISSRSGDNLKNPFNSGEQA